jgi:guanylate kinase
MKKSKRIILVGHAASGKDYLADTFVERGFRKDISMTTRLIREGEVDGLTYHYVSKEQFMMGIANNKFYEYVEFNGWMYGTSKDDWENADVFIMTPSGVASIKPEDRDDCTVVFIEIPEHIRRERMDLRSDSDKTERRIKADKKDFKGFIDYDYRIKNPSFGANAWVDIISRHIK